MNKTVSINIGGQFFHIDENAFTTLDNYINAIKRSIDTEGKDEIIADIENRIAELFHQRIQPNGVIRMETVEEIIAIMGQPEDYIIGDEKNSSSYNFSDENTQTVRSTKKLYRTADQRVLGGVCSGLGYYFNIDPVWIRILFIVLVFFYGVSILIYPILWIIIPKAVSPSQILEMKGIPVNINNIEKEVRDSLGKYIESSKKAISSGTNIVKKFVGITLIVFSIMAIFGSGFGPLILMDSEINVNNNFPLSASNIEQFLDLPFSKFTIGLFFFLCCALPFFIMLVIGIKLMYSKMKHTRWIVSILALIWLATVFAIGLVVSKIVLNKDKISEAFEKFAKTEITHTTPLQLTNQDTLIINFKNDSRLYSHDSIPSNNYSTNKNIRVDFVLSTVEEPYVEVEETKFSSSNTKIQINNGKYEVETSKIPNSLPYELSYNKPILHLAKQIITYKTDDDWDDEDTFDESDVNKVRIKVYLKKGQLVKLNEKDDRYFYHRLYRGIQVYRMENGFLQPVNDYLH